MSVPSLFSLSHLVRQGLQLTENIHYQSTPGDLINDTLRIGEGTLSSTGALVVKTGKFTGRSPKDKYTVKDSITATTINWNEFNQPLEDTFFTCAYDKAMTYLKTLPELWIRDCYACADASYRLNFRLVCEKPWTGLFAYNMFFHPSEEELKNFTPEWTLISVPGLVLNPEECGTKASNATIVSFTKKTILVIGSGYTGETKKGIFYILNYLLPVQKNVLPMHCSANAGTGGDTAIFFGLSGTGKTTLSADPNRKLIGDDEHGWSATNLFNFEGGCYAKTINLSAVQEPQIYAAIREGALVENVVFYPNSNEIDFSNSSITENARVSYPLSYISNAAGPAVGAVPENIFFLTCDASGVLPPVSRLNTEQALYQFISGYTAKIAGTEEGVTEPKPTFSACFGAPFLPLHPGYYAAMLANKLKEQATNVWLINTGWTGGPYGVGERIKLSYTRAMITAALNGRLNTIPTQRDAVFGFAVPVECPGVPTEILTPRNTWQDKEAYDKEAQFLAKLFIENFEQYKPGVAKDVIAAAPVQ